jgi:uncharacterized protein (UPF0335 family)
MLTKEEIENFLDRYRALDAEVKMLQEDKKSLFEELKDRVKPAVLREAIRQTKIREKLGDDVVALEALLEAMVGVFDDE